MADRYKKEKYSSIAAQNGRKKCKGLQFLATTTKSLSLTTQAWSLKLGLVEIGFKHKDSNWATPNDLKVDEGGPRGGGTKRKGHCLHYSRFLLVNASLWRYRGREMEQLSQVSLLHTPTLLETLLYIDTVSLLHIPTLLGTLFYSATVSLLITPTLFGKLLHSATV